MPESWLSLETLALVASATVFGSILFFSVVVTPVAFIKLPKEHAVSYIRAIFPWYYLWLIVMAGLAAFAFAWHHPLEAGLAALIVVLALGSRLFIMPRLDRLREARSAGEEAATRRFRQLHRLSV